MMSSDPIVLLVEDNEDDVLFLRRASRKAGLNTAFETVYDGVEAIEFLRGGARRPTHVLLDLKLPRKSGLEVLEWIRGEQAFKALPVIVLTSSQETSDIERARALVVDEYFVKPVSLPELVDLVRRIAEIWSLSLTPAAS
jgi:CheY-like chemotaxis protein